MFPYFLGNIESGWWFQPIWKILVTWDGYSHYTERQKWFQTTNQEYRCPKFAPFLAPFSRWGHHSTQVQALRCPAKDPAIFLRWQEWMSPRSSMSTVSEIASYRLYMVIDGDLWWFMVIYGDLWWFMVIYGDLWRFMVILRWFYGDSMGFNGV